tara:strand:- start:68 stop:667 length:600 start_codon:yes stop_codon:yes gene_type:complete
MYVVNLNKEINMSNKCPDKLEPQYLTSVLKNVPVELMWHLREYHSKPSHFEIKWRARQPVEGKKFGWGGDLKWEDARSGDMYVRDRSLEDKYQTLQDAHCVLRSEYDDLNDVHGSLSKEYNNLMQDHLDIEEKEISYKDLTLKYNEKYRECLELRDKYDEVCDDMVRKVNKPAIREECDGVDYEAVNNGIKGLINLLRR